MDIRKSMASMNDRLSSTELIKRYDQVRKTHSTVANHMFHEMLMNIDRYEQIIINQKSVNYELDPEVPLDAQLLADLLFYPHLKDGICMSQIYLEEHKLDLENEMIFAMLESKLSIFQFVKRNESTGVVTLKDLVSKETIEIVDRRFGLGRKEPFYYIGRYMTYDGITFLTGLSYSFVMNASTNKYMKKIIEEFQYRKSSDVLAKIHNYYKASPYRM